MARVINEEEYNLRRNEILDAAQMLAYTRGFDLMTIQDMLDQLKISKGAFYHYFDSKDGLLEALVDRMGLTVKALLVPIVEDSHMPALIKLHRFFDTSTRWKTSQKEVFISLLRVWYADNNAVLRQKIVSSGIKWVIPQLTQIIQQGVREGVFSTPYPEQIADVIMGLLERMGDHSSILILRASDGQGGREEYGAIVAAYTDTVERLLSLPSGTLQIVDPSVMDIWFEPSTVKEEPASSEGAASNP